jgi:hypothetical protein
MGQWRYTSTHLSWAPDGGDLLASRFGRFAREESFATLSAEGWVGPIAYLDAVEKRKLSAPAENRKENIRPAVSYSN